MDVGRKMILVFGAALAVTAMAHADMMPASERDADSWKTPRDQTDLQRVTLPDPLGSPDLAHANSLSIEFLPDIGVDGLQSGEVLRPRSLGNGPSSFNLCLCALLGAGLFKSTPRLKRLSFGIIPDWYHDSGPYQIGHSSLVSPNCLCSASLLSFIQPNGRIDNSPPRYRREAVEFLWRKSQFSPTVDAPRGPPNLV